jgi:hypothetical protein
MPRARSRLIASPSPVPSAVRVVPLRLRDRPVDPHLQQLHVLRVPGARSALVHRHRRAEPTVLVQRHADHRADLRPLVRGKVARRHPLVGAHVVHHVRPILVHQPQHLGAEVRHRVAAYDASRIAPGVVAREDEVVLVRVDLRVGAAVDRQVLAQHPRGGAHHLRRVGERLQRPRELSEERHRSLRRRPCRDGTHSTVTARRSPARWRYGAGGEGSWNRRTGRRRSGAGSG